MTSPFCERAIEEALHYGNALLKFISPNDAGITGTHQYGYYLPKSVCLSGHPKSGQWWSPENRPMRKGQDKP